MPKRKHSEYDYAEISRKMKKLERKLLRARRRETRPPSSELSPLSPSYSSEHHIGEDNYEDQAIPVDDYYDEVLGSQEAHNDGNLTSPVAPAPLEEAGEDVPIQISTVNDVIVEPATDQVVADTLDKETLEILGEDPSTTSVYGKDIHIELASRLQHILVNGLTKDARKEVTSKYLVPANCTAIAAPELNLEIKAALPEMSLRRDKAMETKQKQLATAISCLSEVISNQLQTKNSSLLKSLMDAMRILCDLQHGDSIKRRYFATSSLKKDITDQLIATKVDKYLFGDNLGERLKAAKAVSKSSAEIKVDINKHGKKTTQQQPSTSKKFLNWKTRGTARRPPAPPNNRQPASARVRQESSSMTSHRHPASSKHNHRR